MNVTARERRRSLKIVQIIFAGLALFSLAAAIAVSMNGIEYGLPESSASTISLAFLIVGIADTALVYFWERLFQNLES